MCESSFRLELLLALYALPSAWNHMPTCRPGTHRGAEPGLQLLRAVSFKFPVRPPPPSNVKNVPLIVPFRVKVDAFNLLKERDWVQREAVLPGLCSIYPQAFRFIGRAGRIANVLVGGSEEDFSECIQNTSLRISVQMHTDSVLYQPAAMVNWSTRQIDDHHFQIRKKKF